ncbi:hypothetical protein [Solimonas fluminis]|uniref:hypothetical protein n=1 Tax=Solimonas fluminis TaxID=2086571 RepID=UPI00105717A7|nr:hypothetical protein [Solimonas fluminis]
MKGLFQDAVAWSERSVGSPLSFWLNAFLQLFFATALVVAGFIAQNMLQVIIAAVFAGLTPVFTSYALRQVLLELRAARAALAKAQPAPQANAAAPRGLS